jgi:RNA polymerase sigma-70 factor, ECF subfamily
VKVVDTKELAELVARIRNGERDAEEDLMRRLKPAVTIIIHKATGGDRAAPDLCQDTLRLLLVKIRQGELRHPERLPSFVRRLAQNLVIDHYRRFGGRYVDIAGIGELTDPSPDPRNQLLLKEKAQIVRQVLNQLESDREREALYRFYLVGDDKQDICADFGMTTLQFNMVLHRARNHYRKLYKEFIRKLNR